LVILMLFISFHLILDFRLRIRIHLNEAENSLMKIGINKKNIEGVKS